MAINRISTNGQYQFSLGLMLAKQAELAKTYQQVSTGSRLNTGADDPLAAGRSIQMDRTLARLDQYDDNAKRVESRLNQQESVLSQAGDLLTRVRTLTIQANNATLSDEDRKSLTGEIRSIHDQLLALANTDDGTGRYLFGGSQDGNAPFVLAGNSVSYVGDQTQRQVEVSSGMKVDDTLPGSEVFMRIRTGDGDADASANGGNTGTGVLMDFGITDSTAWNKASYDIVFTAADAYEVRDAGGVVVATGSYQDGDTITHGGVQMRITGQPDVGDGFHVGPAGTRDIFSTLDNLVGALESTSGNPQQQASQQNALQSALRDISTAQQRFIDARAEGGANQAALDNAGSLNEARSITTKTSLSAMRDVDYAEALSRYSQESTALQAAQQVFARMQQLSLFDQI